MKPSQFYLLLVVIVAAPRMAEPWALIFGVVAGFLSLACARKERS